MRTKLIIFCCLCIIATAFTVEKVNRPAKADIKKSALPVSKKENKRCGPFITIVNNTGATFATFSIVGPYQSLNYTYPSFPINWESNLGYHTIDVSLGGTSGPSEIFMILKDLTTGRYFNCDNMTRTGKTAHLYEYLAPCDQFELSFTDNPGKCK